MFEVNIKCVIFRFRHSDAAAAAANDHKSSDWGRSKKPTSLRTHVSNWDNHPWVSKDNRDKKLQDRPRWGAHPWRYASKKSECVWERFCGDGFFFFSFFSYLHRNCENCPSGLQIKVSDGPSLVSQLLERIWVCLTNRRWYQIIPDYFKALLVFVVGLTVI